MENQTGTQTQGPKQEIAKQQPSHSERFVAAVEREFGGNNGELQLTQFQRKLIQNYFIRVDMVLKEAERKRMAKKEQYRDPVPLTWQNVNMARLANDVVHYSAVGMDPAQPNHINPIPYKNNGTDKYDITFIMGYKGIEIKARKYGLDVPKEVTVELVYSNDKFKVFKKDVNNPIETYQFEVSNPLDRGTIMGGFYYMSYDNSKKNTMTVFSMADIEKRKPAYASPEFWGGEKDKYEHGQKVGREKVEGWLPEMCLKTLYRAAYGSITIDSQLIDDDYRRVIEREAESRDVLIAQTITERANKTEIGFEDDASAIQEPEYIMDTPADTPVAQAQTPAPEPQQQQAPEPPQQTAPPAQPGKKTAPF